jgi:enoyl-CoA hydratase
VARPPHGSIPEEECRVGEYKTLRVSIENQVATVVIDHELDQRWGSEPGFSSHWEFADAMEALRADNGVRVVVITGSHGYFKSLRHDSLEWRERHVADVSQRWLTFTGLIRWHQAMAEMEKPIVAKVNGHATTSGQSIAFASDIIVARRDAIFMDNHMVQRHGDTSFSLVPGDGGAALIPLYMSPAKAKEYLMLSKPYTGAELAEMGLINYAVEPEELDAKVDEIVRQLLERGAYALAWTKRAVNRRIVEQLNQTLDAAAAYEMVNFMQLDKLGWKERRTL